MLVIPVAVLSEVMQVLVQATHHLTDLAGERKQLSTIDERRLRSAALAALLVATGDSVMPGDERITVRRPRQSMGVVNYED